jgi:hypothetical protein
VKEFLVYTAARFAVFGGCAVLSFGLFWVISGGEDVPVLWPLLLAAVLSVLVSAWLLRDLRDRFAASVQARADRAVAARRDREPEHPSSSGARPEPRSGNEPSADQ